MTERAHRKLPVWKASIDLVEAFYVVSAKFPREEMFGPQSQMRQDASPQAQLGYVQGQLLAVIQSLKRRSR
jgi:hypothetical protein